MKITLKSLLLVVVAAFVAASFATTPLSAVEPEEPAEESVRLPPPVRLIDNSVGELELTEEQEKKYQEVFKQHAPQIQKQYVQQQSVYTPEQKKKRREAVKKGKQEGLKGRKLQQYVQSQVPLTPQQQKQHTDYQTEILKSQQKFRQDVEKILTPQQREKLPRWGGKKGKGKGKRGKLRPGKPGPQQSAPQQSGPDQPAAPSEQPLPDAQ